MSLQPFWTSKIKHREISIGGIVPKNCMRVLYKLLKNIVSKEGRLLKNWAIHFAHPVQETSDKKFYTQKIVNLYFSDEFNGWKHLFVVILNRYSINL